MDNSITLSIISAIAWGMTAILDKIVVSKYSVIYYILYRIFIYGALSLLFYIFVKQFYPALLVDFQKQTEFINTELFNYSVLSAIILMVATFTYLFALSYKTSLVNVITISYILPVIIMAILSVYVFNHTITPKMIVGMFITFFGIYYTISNNPNR